LPGDGILAGRLLLHYWSNRQERPKGHKRRPAARFLETTSQSAP
jgi:hypothetical protein